LTFNNFVRSLRAFCRRRPFSPFLVEMVSGTVLRVPHPEAVRLYGEVAMYTAPDSTERLFDCTSVCEMYDVPPTDLSGDAKSETEEST
jgi:hypothetical protein